MKLISSLLVMLSTPPANALVPDTTQLTCNEARGFVGRNGVINMTSGTPKYTRYVASQSGEHCFGDEVTRNAVVPTLDDTQCLVGYICVDPVEAIANSDAPTFMPN